MAKITLHVTPTDAAELAAITAALAPFVSSGAPAAAEEAPKPKRRAPRKAKPAEEPKAEEPKAEEPKAEEPKAEEPAPSRSRPPVGSSGPARLCSTPCVAP